jgi:hypothetical protein
MRITDPIFDLVFINYMISFEPSTKTTDHARIVKMKRINYKDDSIAGQSS